MSVVHMLLSRALVTVSALVVLGLILISPTEANGRVTGLITQQAGPYEIALGTIPDRPVVGALHMTMTISDSSTQTPVLDADISVVGTGPGATEIELGPLRAQNNPTDPAFYDVNTTVDRVGIWSFNVSVDADAGEGQTDFVIDVQTANLLVKIMTWAWVAVFLAIVGLAVIPVIRQRRRRGRSAGVDDS